MESAQLSLLNCRYLQQKGDRKTISVPEGDARFEKLNYDKIENKFVKSNQSSILILRLRKLGSDFWDAKLIIWNILFRYSLPGNLTGQQPWLLSSGIYTKNNDIDGKRRLFFEKASLKNSWLSTIAIECFDCNQLLPPLGY